MAQRRGKRHVVQGHEDLHTLAQAYGMSWKALARINALKPPYQLREGQTLVVVPSLKLVRKFDHIRKEGRSTVPHRLATIFSRSFLFVLSILTICSTLLLSPPKAGAVAQGDGTLVYGEGAVTTPRNRQWTQGSTSFGGENSNPAAAASVRHVVTKASPTRDEIIVGVQTTGGVLYIQRYNGTSWSSEWNVTVGDGNLPRFDIAFEPTSGDALVVYSGNVATTNELRYRVWNGTSWTGATNLDAIRTTGTVHAVQLKAGQANNDIALAWGDSNFDLSANYWLGATNTWGGEPAIILSASLSKIGTATTLTNWSFDIAIESVSGDVLVAWGDDAVLDLKHITRTTGSGGAWAGSVTTTTAANEEPVDMELASDPNSNYIAYATISDNGADADASTWTGSAWNAFSNFDITCGTVAAGTKNISVSWLRSGIQDRAVVTYEDSAAAGVDWIHYNKNTNVWTTNPADFTTAPAPLTDMKTTRMITNPFNTSQLMLTVVEFRIRPVYQAPGIRRHQFYLVVG
jgi:hypothetical protein